MTTDPSYRNSLTSADAGSTNRGNRVCVETCPTCRRSGIDTDVCPRCGTGLGQLNRIVTIAEDFSLAGHRLLRQSRNTEAITAFDAALALCNSPAARRGRAVALAGADRFAEALREIMLSREADPFRVQSPL